MRLKDKVAIIKAGGAKKEVRKKGMFALCASGAYR